VAQNVKLSFEVMNICLVAVGLALIALGSYARSSYWWEEGGGLVGWGYATTLIAILTGVFLFFASLLGLSGSQARSSTILLVYNLTMGVLAFLGVTFGTVCLVLLRYVEEIVTDNWSSLQKVLPDGVDKADVIAELRANQATLGGSTIVGGVMMIVACTLGMKVRLRFLGTFRELPEWLRSSTILFLSSLGGIVVSIICVGFGIYAIQVTYYTKFLLFPQYMLVVIGMVLLQINVAGALVARGTTLRNPEMLRGFLWLLVACVVVLIGLSGFTVSKVNGVSDHIDVHWAEIDALLRNSTNRLDYNLDKKGIKLLTQNNLIIGAVLENMEVWILSMCVWTSFKLHKKLQEEQENGHLEAGGGSLNVGAEADDSSESVTTFETYVLAYCCLATMVHIFWEGEYVVFHTWLLPTAQPEGDLRSEWFLAGWRTYIHADKRYEQGSALLLAKESVAALVGGPACIYLAWATYERKAIRDVVAITVCVIELYSISITFGSGLVTSYTDNSEQDAELVLHFWFLFVFVAVLRLLAPLPILYKSCNHVWTCVKYHDDYVKLKSDNGIGLEDLTARWEEVEDRATGEGIQGGGGVVVGRAVTWAQPGKGGGGEAGECVLEVSERDGGARGIVQRKRGGGGGGGGVQDWT